MINAIQVQGWTEEKLRRKWDQESEMVSLAAAEGDHADVKRRVNNIKIIQQELLNRR